MNPFAKLGSMAVVGLLSLVCAGHASADVIQTLDSVDAVTSRQVLPMHVDATPPCKRKVFGSIPKAGTNGSGGLHAANAATGARPA